MIALASTRPLACGYPSTPPPTGGYLSLVDTLPDPAPGAGRWFVTAVNYQGSVRAGRRAAGGVLSGRDASMLAGCP